ncbi:MAG: hypothetical protein CL666_00565 [Balneola sp.]|nr:hypothetical protein [Balneola sp.]|tara:strand:+ start:38140 stop:38556 length:417 start_codon:yes stop_codon:yes gene_type:complete
MSTGQTFLTLGAIVLLSYTSLNVNRMYVSSVKDRVDIQRDIEVISYGQSLSELLYSYSPEAVYPTLDNFYGDCEAVNNSCVDLVHETELGFTLYAIVTLQDSPIADTLATISIFDDPDADQDEFVAQFNAAITRIPTN